MVKKAAGQYSKTKEDQLSEAAKAAFGWFSTCYCAFIKKEELFINDNKSRTIPFIKCAYILFSFATKYDSNIFSF